eukprot:SAG31_NODE_5966_length_2234_cov_6.011144_2_plen_102_part_00
MYRALLKNKRLRGRNVDPDHPWALVADKHARDAARKVMRCVGAIYHVAASLAVILTRLFTWHRQQKVEAAETAHERKRREEEADAQLGSPAVGRRSKRRCR